ncbi:hypothetical protein BH23CHL5_BH23CHL5_18830 [soil metagenome]
MRLLAALLVITGILVVQVSRSAAQEATPVAGACAIEPRTSDEISVLSEEASTQPAPETSAASVRLPAGDSVDEETITQLLTTLNEADACAAERDLGRFLALYTDRFVVESIFAPEPEGIAEGAIPDDQEDAAPEPSAPQVTVIDAAVLLDDSRIAAHVFKLGEPGFGSIVWFELVDGRWLVDEIRRAADPPVGTTTVPAGAQSLVDRVIEDAAEELGVEAEDLELVSIKSVDWPDGGLGCPREGEAYIAVITPGYRIVLSAGSNAIVYHTDTVRSIVQCSGIEGD